MSTDRFPVVWVALDVPDVPAAEALIERLHPHRHFKVGLELFAAAGPDPVRRWVDRGLSVFLDLKLHDIPKTVERATVRVRELGVSLLTVHAAGGRRMLEGAVAGAGGTLQVAAVTVLTSLDRDALGQMGLPPAAELARTLYNVARGAGVSAFIASASEVAELREADARVRLVVPGIRLPGDAADDQARIAGPDEAVARGATDLVVGRSVTRAPDPRAQLSTVEDLVRRVARG
jgi:orotidine-5'-phosphate decarboxylase